MAFARRKNHAAFAGENDLSFIIAGNRRICQDLKANLSAESGGQIQPCDEMPLMIRQVPFCLWIPEDIAARPRHPNGFSRSPYTGSQLSIDKSRRLSSGSECQKSHGRFGGPPGPLTTDQKSAARTAIFMLFLWKKRPCTAERPGERLCRSTSEVVQNSKKWHMPLF